MCRVVSFFVKCPTVFWIFPDSMVRDKVLQAHCNSLTPVFPSLTNLGRKPVWQDTILQEPETHSARATFAISMQSLSQLPHEFTSVFRFKHSQFRFIVPLFEIEAYSFGLLLDSMAQAFNGIGQPWYSPSDANCRKFKYLRVFGICFLPRFGEAKVSRLSIIVIKMVTAVSLSILKEVEYRFDQRIRSGRWVQRAFRMKGNAKEWQAGTVSVQRA